MTRPGSTTAARVQVLSDGAYFSKDDVLATEEPLEIRVAAGGEVRPLATTMRTPGADFELAAGLLRTEGLIGDRHAIRRIEYCLDGPAPAAGAAGAAGDQHYNVVTVHLAADRLPDLSPFERYGTMTSACGVCGKASLEALHLRGLEPLPHTGPVLDVETLFRLPDALRAAQRNFSSTGGLHAAGLFTADGDVLAVREDVGRHNAVDKVIGWSLLRGPHPQAGAVLMVSGRAGFEIVQKAVAAGVPVVCAVSAPSSLAVAVAAEFGLTLVGFLRGRRANVYSGADRIAVGSH